MTRNRYMALASALATPKDYCWHLSAAFDWRSGPRPMVGALCQIPAEPVHHEPAAIDNPSAGDRRAGSRRAVARHLRRRTSLTVSSTAIGLSLLIGLFVGAACGYFGGMLDRVVMVGVDLTWSFPEILIALMLVAVVGPGLGGVVCAVAIAYLAQFTRLTRTQVISLTGETYIEADSKSRRHALSHPVFPPSAPCACSRAGRRHPCYGRCYPG